MNYKKIQRATWNKEDNVGHEKEIQYWYRKSEKNKLKFWKWKAQKNQI
jgi:hypothetical protein